MNIANSVSSLLRRLPISRWLAIDTGNTRSVLLVTLALSFSVLLQLWLAGQVPLHMDEIAGPLHTFNDEEAHFKYILFLKNHRNFPTFTRMNDSNDSTAVERDWIFKEFEYPQPPFYYLLNAPLAFLPHAQMLCRLLSIAFSFLTLMVVLRCIALMCEPKEQHLLVAAALVGFSPIYLRIGSSICNDVLASLISAMLFLAYLRDPLLKRKMRMSVLLGIGLLSKLSLMVWVPFLALTALSAKENRGPVVKRTIGILLGATVIAGWWYVRNIYLYAEWSGLMILSNRPQSNLTSLSPGRWSAFVSVFIHTIFFPVLEERAAWMSFFLAVVVLLALCLFLQYGEWKLHLRPSARAPVALFCILAFVQFLYGNMHYEFPEARFLFIAIAPIAGLLTCVFSHNFGKLGFWLAIAINLLPLALVWF